MLLQFILTAMLSFTHPYFVSMTEIEHDTKTNMLEISVRIFTDDFEKTIRQTYKGKVDLLNKDDKANSEKLIEQYITKHLFLIGDNKNLSLHFDGFETEEGSIWSYFECADITSLKKLEVTNTLLYDYEQQQINFIHVKAANYDETIKLNYPDNTNVFVLK